MVLKAEFCVLRAVWSLCHCVSGARSTVASSDTMFCQLTPDAKPETASDDDNVLALAGVPIWGIEPEERIELMVLDVDI
jgi:hypothetical protein